MDELILLYLKTNKNRALSILYKKYYDKIFSMSRKILKDKNEAEDCVQEVFIKVMENIDKFRFGSSISTWIYRIAINHIINKNKKVEYYLEIDEEKLYDKLKYEIEISELEEKINQALKSLTETEQKIFVLREFEGFSYKEIAKIMDINEGTVKSKIHYIRLKLKDMLEKYIKD